MPYSLPIGHAHVVVSASATTADFLTRIFSREMEGRNSCFVRHLRFFPLDALHLELEKGGRKRNIPRKLFSLQCMFSIILRYRLSHLQAPLSIPTTSPSCVVLTFSLIYLTPRALLKSKSRRRRFWLVFANSGRRWASRITQTHRCVPVPHEPREDRESAWRIG